MKILFRNDLLYGGGAESVLRIIANEFANQGHDVTICVNDFSENQLLPFDKRINYLVYKPFRSSAKSFFARVIRKIKGLIFIKRWNRIINELRFDIVIAFKEGEIMKEVSKYSCKKKICWIHVDYLTFHYTSSLFKSNNSELKCMKKFKSIICVSESARNSLIKTVGDTKNIVVCYNPLDFKSMRYMAEQSNLSLRRKRFTFLSVGRLAYPKNFMSLLKAVSTMGVCDFDLWIVGDGPDRVELETFISNKKIKNVHLLGFLDNPYPYYKAADAYISSSLSESYGLSIQEALIFGLPVIAVECPAIKESLNSSFGILCDSSPSEIAKAMEKMITDKNMYESFKQNILKQYDVNDLYYNRLSSISLALGLAENTKCGDK